MLRSSNRYSGVAAVVTVWTTLVAATAASNFDLLGPRPLSYLGIDPASTALFTIGLAVTALLLTAFHQYVRQHHRVGTGFSVIMLAGLAGQLVAAFVPVGGDGTAHRIHTACALVLGASLPLLMWRFAAGQPPGRWRRVAYRLFWVEAVACAIGVCLAARRIGPLPEILDAAAFHAWVLVVTFAGPRLDPTAGPAEAIVADRADGRAGSRAAAVSVGPCSSPKNWPLSPSNPTRGGTSSARATN